MFFQDLTIAHIKARTEEVGDCWIWQQGSTNGYPQMKVQAAAASWFAAWWWR